MNVLALAIRITIPFRISSGCRASAWPASGETRQPERLPYKQNANASRLTADRRGVREKAPLQDQLSKGMCVGRPRVEQQRCECIAEMREQPVILEAKIDIGKIAVTSRPTLGDSWSNSTQDFAALHLRRLFLLFFRFGMKRAGGLRRIDFRRHGCERAMIRDRQPGTDRNRNDQATYTRFNIQCLLRSERTRPLFK